jgi:cell division protein FtsB
MLEIIIEIKGPARGGKTYLLRRLADYLTLSGYLIKPNFDANRLMASRLSNSRKESLMELMVARAVRETPDVATKELLRLTKREAELEQEIAKLKEKYGVLP